METSEPIATRSAAATVGGTTVGRVRRVRATQTAAQATHGGIATRPTGAQAVRAGVGGGSDDGRPGHAGGRGRAGRSAVAVLSGRGRVHRHAVPGGCQRRAVELPDHSRGHRAERVVRARVSHVSGHVTAAVLHMI